MWRVPRAPAIRRASPPRSANNRPRPAPASIPRPFSALNKMGVYDLRHASGLPISRPSCFSAEWPRDDAAPGRGLFVPAPIAGSGEARRTSGPDPAIVCGPVKTSSSGSPPGAPATGRAPAENCSRRVPGRRGAGRTPRHPAVPPAESSARATGDERKASHAKPMARMMCRIVVSVAGVSALDTAESSDRSRVDRLRHSCCGDDSDGHSPGRTGRRCAYPPAGRLAEDHGGRREQLRLGARIVLSPRGFSEA